MLLGEDQRPESFLGKCINIIVKHLGLVVPMRFFEDGRISTLGVHDDLIAILNILDNYTHSSPAAEANYIDQLIFLLPIQYLQLDDALRLFDELVTQLAGKVYEADFIRTRALVFFFLGVADYVVADDHPNHEFMKFRLRAQ